MNLEETYRQRFILKILLIFSVICIGGIEFAFIVDKIIRNSVHNNWHLTDFGILLCLLLFVSATYKAKYYEAAAYELTWIYLLSPTYLSYIWGINLPAAILGYALVIVVSNILCGTRYGFIMTGIISFTVLILWFTDTRGIIQMDQGWRTDSIDFDDIFPFIITYFLIMGISWLYNTEIFKSLEEVKLQKERDSLETIVKIRTEELRHAEFEKMSQLYRFVEFGRLSSGIFHDIINPLSAMILNVKEIKTCDSHVTNALQIASRIEKFMCAAQNQIQTKELSEIFNPYEEIQKVIDVFSYKTKICKARIHTDLHKNTVLYGNPLRFNQMITNIISNALDSSTDNNKNFSVSIILKKEKTMSIIKIKDTGQGIREENIGRIFEPFFSTKPADKGIGLGLSITKEIIEKDFSGEISVQSSNKGTCFTIQLPIKICPLISPVVLAHSLP